MRSKAPKGWIKISDFERLTGLSNKTITAAIKGGKIPASCVDRVGKYATSPYYLEPQKSAIAWRGNINANHPLSRPILDKLAKYIRRFDPAAVSDNGKQTKSTGKTSTEKMTLADAQLKERIAKAELAELELREKAGALVDKSRVYDQLFAAGQELRNALLAIPDRITDELIALSDNRTQVHNTIYNAIAAELEKLNDIQRGLTK